MRVRPGNQGPVQEDIEKALDKGEADESQEDSQEKGPPSISGRRCLFLVCGHACCAASLLVINKWALKRFPYVWTLATIQFVFASSLTFAAGKIGLVAVDALDVKK